ncbi:MAG: preprotein translocase subunit YajC [Clostridia bacterium]|nr:preprotein translocase subunit YajC [Clostridia bacterium]
MLFNLLETTQKQNPWLSWVIMGVLLVVIIVFMILSRRSQKKRQQEQMDQLNAIGPGNKVKTIGGICGVVVEVCPEDNTFILETGSEASGKSYIKFDKQAVYQTDAVAKKAEPAVVEAPAEAPAEELPVVEAPAEEDKAE